MNEFLEWLLPNAVPIVASIGLFLTFWTLRANHDWNRRLYATGLVAKWNDETSAHRKAIEKIRPGLVDLNRKDQRIIELTKADADAIYTTATDSPEWELRFHFIELLNHFESIASAYKNSVGDRQIIEESLRNPLIRWHDLLLNFIATVKSHRGYEPWEPYTSVIQHWKRTDFKARSITG